MFIKKNQKTKKLQNTKKLTEKEKKIEPIGSFRLDLYINQKSITSVQFETELNQANPCPSLGLFT